MSSILAERHHVASEILSNTDAFNDDIVSFIEEGLTERLTRAVYDTIVEASKLTGGRGYTPRHQMGLMILQSEFEWLFFDIDDHVDENFMNDTADELPDVYVLSCYYILAISIVNHI